MNWRYMIRLILAAFWLSMLVAPALATGPYKPDQQFEYSPGHSLHYRVQGSGQRKILLLHGLGASHRTWDNLLQHWAVPPDTQLIMFDLIGFGFSSKSPHTDHSMRANSRAIRRFIKRHGLKDYTLIGHSFGGGVALMTALSEQTEGQHPPSGLILIDAATYPSDFPLFVELLRLPLLNNILLNLVSPETRAELILERLFHEPDKITPQLIERYAFFHRLPGHNATLTQTATQVLPENLPDLLKQYSRLQVPTLVIWGQQDQTIPIEYGKRLAEELPSATLSAIKDCGHMPQTECPRQTATAISNFLTPP